MFSFLYDFFILKLIVLCFNKIKLRELINFIQFPLLSMILELEQNFGNHQNDEIRFVRCSSDGKLTIHYWTVLHPLQTFYFLVTIYENKNYL